MKQYNGWCVALGVTLIDFEVSRLVWRRHPSKIDFFVSLLRVSTGASGCSRSLFAVSYLEGPEGRNEVEFEILFFRFKIKGKA